MVIFLFSAGLDYARRALDLNSNDAEAHKWFAILTGAYGDYLGMKEKIEGGYVFKDHVEKAITLRPDDASLRHLVGRFKFEVNTNIIFTFLNSLTLDVKVVM